MSLGGGGKVGSDYPLNVSVADGSEAAGRGPAVGLLRREAANGSHRGGARVLRARGGAERGFQEYRRASRARYRALPEHRPFRLGREEVDGDGRHREEFAASGLIPSRP